MITNNNYCSKKKNIKKNKAKQKQNNIYTYIYENNLLASFHSTAEKEKEKWQITFHMVNSIVFFFK